MPNTDGQSQGPAIDRKGAPVVDPTENVKALQEASNHRQDDLRLLTKELIDAKIACQKEMQELRDKYSDKLAEAEAKRIDAIRAVDVNAVAVASERQAAAATVLANQVAQSADALRTLVSTTATATAEQNRQALGQITDRLSVVERSQYEGRGKSSYSDPMMIEMVSELKRVSALMATGTGKSAGGQAMWGYIVGAAGFLLVLFELFGKR